MNERPTYTRLTLLLILALSAFRILVANALDLGNDESYYWLYSQRLAANYFDHPPLVAVWTRLFTVNGTFDSELMLRLGSIAGCAISTWLLFLTGRLLHSPRAGFFSACLYQASLYAGLTAGVYLMPDAPQMVFWTGSLLTLAHVFRNDRQWAPWTCFGLLAGLCLLCKVHGAFLWIGLGLYAVFLRRDWLRRPHIYVAAVLTILLFTPVIAWNIDYDFITYRFHSHRVALEDMPFNRFSFPREILHQLIWNNPVNVALAIGSLACLRRLAGNLSRALTLYAFIGIPLILFLLFVSLFRDTVLPHWSGPGHVALIPGTAIWLATKTRRAVPVILKASLGLFLVVVAGWVVLVQNYPGNLGRKGEARQGQGDITLDQFGWRETGHAFAEWYRREVGAGTLPPATPLVCTYWWGAHVEYYFARPLRVPMLGAAPVYDLHHYSWTNSWRLPGVQADTVLCVLPSADAYALPASYYRTVRLDTTFEARRGGKPAQRFSVYRLEGLRRPLPSIR
jgi:4-amino-4-deoxy-L-arabinose transferase-like glycosyltransferase